jgi:hypothetical protein
MAKKEGGREKRRKTKKELSALSRMPAAALQAHKNASKHAHAAQQKGKPMLQKLLRRAYANSKKWGK